MTLKVIPALDISVIPRWPRSVILQFNVGKNLPYPIAFDIYRTGDGESLEKLNVSPITQFFFEDVGLKPQSKLFDVVYFVDIIFPFKADKQRIGPVHLVPQPRLARTFFIARRMDEKHGIEYESHTGIELAIYKRKHWGEKCTSCYNPILEAATTTNCNDCLGTNYVGGYWNPISVLGKLEPLTKSRNLLDKLNYQENIVIQAHMRAFPLIQEDDIIREVRRNVLWYGQAVQMTEHGRYPVKQLVELREIERGDPLYKSLGSIPVNTSEECNFIPRFQNL